ncbi:hypothetical protein [Clostridium sp. BJN0001]|uniref:hypothetical protein n=1 Tax=Clostridium sp. BJN0001 TaxID=2930219 RepID=UPI001FD606E3|nr:hypothetical protein [Clostridium sp. BJN0001]
MIYICTSMYAEAEPFIKKLNLKKDTSITKFQLFYGGNFLLIITGCGKIKASICLTYILTKRNPSPSDFIFNIGLCGSKNCNNEGDAFLINKIIDNDTKKSYYTDVLFKHPFKESDIETFSTIVKKDDTVSCSLADMESSGIYESASYFFKTYQIFFIKIVSDFFNDSIKKDIEKVKSLIYKNSDKIITFLNKLDNDFSYKTNILSEDDVKTIDTISCNLKFSSSMENELKRIIKYNNLKSKGVFKITDSLSNLKCGCKKEGKIILEKIKQRYI